MTAADHIYRHIQRAARDASAGGGRSVPTGEYLMRHAVESFLDRLTKTEHADKFVLKGGILLAAYGARRPTKDVDVGAVGVEVSAESIADVVRTVEATEADDGVVFDVHAIGVREIREGAEYPGLRLRVPAARATWRGTVVWDISTGDPIVPIPRWSRCRAFSARASRSSATRRRPSLRRRG